MGIRMPAPHGRDTVQHARRGSDAPPEPDLAELAARSETTRLLVEEHLARLGPILDAIEAGRPLPDGTGRQLTLIAAGLRQAGAAQWMTGEQMRERSLEQVFTDMERAVIEGSGFRAGVTAAAAGRHRHRRDRKPAAGQLSLIPGGKWRAPAVSGAAALAAFRHAATAKGAAIGTSAAAAAAVVTIGTSGFTTLPMTTPAPAAAHAGAFAGLAPTDALPLVPPPPLRSYAPRHAKPSADADAATLAPPPPAGLAASPSPSGPSAAPRNPAYGTLNVATIACTVGLSGTAQIVFTAVGGALQWHASSSSPDLKLSSDGAILGKGQSAMITVSVPRGLSAGSATVTIWAGGQSAVVPVTWVALPGLGL